MNKPATIADVARLAGVSPATVSRVINGNTKVQSETVQRVLEAAGELSYVPSTAARSLSLGRTKVVSLLVPDLSNPMFQQVLRGAHSAAAADGYRLLVSDTVEEPDSEPELARETRRHSDALILCAPRMPELELERVLEQARPVVLVNRDTERSDVPVLRAEYGEGAQALAELLHKHGHRSFAYLAGPESSVSNGVRIAALEQFAASNSGVTVTSLPCGAWIDDGAAAVPSVLGSGATAILAYNDLVALGLIGRLREAGIAVPEDISVVGYDDIPFARYATPPLTTVSVPHETLGRYAWEMTKRVLDSNPETHALKFAPRLMDRGSAGPAPRTALPGAPADLTDRQLAWRRDDDDVAVDLTINGALLTRYERRPIMPSVYGPRPYLHPVSTLAGSTLTAVTATQIRHQHGLSVALPWVDGINYWGGRTHIAGTGPVLLPNHGTQVSVALTVSGTGLTERLQWRRPDGTPHLLEERAMTASLGPEEGWLLRWRSSLTPVEVDEPVEIHTPSIDGRPDARYGGIFWRFPTPQGVQISCADGVGGRAAHGSRSGWLALSSNDDKPWTVLLHQPEDRVPWHVRSDNYLGVCSAVAWDGPIHLASGEQLPLAMDALLLDRAIDHSEIPTLLEAM